jgi:hypothetical protein
MYHRLPGCWLEFNLKMCMVNALSVNMLQHLLHFITQAYAMATLCFNANEVLSSDLLVEWAATRHSKGFLTKNRPGGSTSATRTMHCNALFSYP